MSNRIAAGAAQDVFRFNQFSINGITHGITGRDQSWPSEADFSYFTGKRREDVDENRQRWADAIGVNLDRLVCGRQVHGTSIQTVSQINAGSGSRNIEDAVQRVDGLMTQVPGLPIAVFCADCVPVLLYDPDKHAVAAVHAGWRGTVQNIAGKVVRQMAAEFGSDPAHLRVGLGPSIGPCCYEVGDEVIDAWRKTDLDPDEIAVLNSQGRTVFDLWQANHMALVDAGVSPDSIENQRICTRCNNERFFSRRWGQGHRGLFAAIIQLDPHDE